ncbi:MAG TPA: LamG-like jellyroll fold domain-containing protein, partial [Pyrinomonadaceae bacterium]
RTLVTSFICALALAGGRNNAQAQTSCVRAPLRTQMEWFPADGSTADILENANSTLKNGATFAPGMVGQAFSFDGVDDYTQINFLPLPSPYNTLSYEMWIKPANVQTGHIVDMASSGGTDGFMLELSGGHLRATFGANAATGSATIPADAYTHVAAVYDGSHIRLYVNGALDIATPATAPGAAALSSVPLLVGAGQSPGAAFNGQIDEIEFYLGVLTAADVQSIHGAGAAGKCKAGRALISEFRIAARENLTEEFIEIYNNSDSELVVQSTDGSAGWGAYEEGLSGVARPLFVIPNGTRIPARGNYLGISRGARSGAPPTGPPNPNADAGYVRDYCFSCALVLLSSSVGRNSPDHRLDRVGFTNTSLFFREGNGVPSTQPRPGGVYDYSYIRKMTSGIPQDTGDNAADFMIVSNEPTATGGVFGTPGPQNLHSPLQRNKTFKASPLDAGAAGSASPNRVMQATDTDGDGTTDAAVLKIRRTFTNLTKEPISRLRFRVVDITTAPQTDNTKADLRVINSRDEIVNISAEGGGGTKIATGITLEHLSDMNAARSEGGLNTSLVFPLAVPLQPGESVDVNFWLRVAAVGEFNFLVNVEAAAPSPAITRKRPKAGTLKSTP